MLKNLKKSISLIAAFLMIGTMSVKAEVVVASAGPMTGDLAVFGEQLKYGAEMWEKDVNAKGGINGEKVRLEIGDDACDPKQAVAVANKLVGMGAVYVAGHFCSSSSIPASAVYSEAGVIQVSPASTNPNFTDKAKSDHIFRVCGRDDQQGEVAGKYIADNYKGKKVAVIHDKTAYGKGLADETRKNMKKNGLKAALYEAYTAGEKDYSALVSKLKSKNIDVLYIGGYHAEAGLMARQMKDQSMNVQIISGDALVTQEYWNITGDAGEGTLMTFGPDPRGKPSAKAVVKKFEAAGLNPEGYVLYSYAALQVFEQAATKAKSTKPNDVKKAMRSTAFDTVIGTINFDKKGDVIATSKDPLYIFYKFSKGGYAPL
jgi:branched-chain amino acid transport system substrate-binding protein